jgi:hypothetical protein
MEERKRGRNRRDEFYVKTVYYSGGVFKIAHAPRLFGVDWKRAKQIVDRLLYEGVLLKNKKPLILFRRAGFRGDKIRMVTHASSTEILLTTILVLSAVGVPFLNYWILPQADETYRLARLAIELFAFSILLQYYGLVILAFYTYTKRLCGLGKKLRLRVRFKYKHDSETKNIVVTENITVRQLIKLAFKRMKKDWLIVENYDAILDRDNNPPLRLRDKRKRLYEYGITDKDKISVVSVKRLDGGAGYTWTRRPVSGWRFTESLKTFLHQSPRHVLGWVRNVAEKFSKYFRTRTRRLKAW